MAGKVSIECPACAAKLNLSDSSKLGKKIRCPKCSEVFVAEAPDDELFEDDDDLFEDDMEEDDDQPAPSSSKKRGSATGKEPAKGAKKGTKKGAPPPSGPNVPLIIGGVVGLLALVGGGLYFSGIFNSKPLPTAPATAVAPMPALAAPMQPPAPPPQMTAAEKMLGLRWMSAETDLLIHLKVAEVFAAPLLKGPLSDPSVTAAQKEFETNVGLKPTEIESISLGLIGLANAITKASPPSLMNGFGLGGPSVPAVAPEDQHFIMVVKTRKPIDLKVDAQQFPAGSIKELNGKSYLDIPSANAASASGGVWSPDSTTVIFATTKELMATMQRGETVIPRKEFAAIDHLPQLVLAGIVPPPKTDGTQLPPGMSAGMVDPKDLANIRMVNLGLSVKGGFELKLAATSTNPESAKKLKTEVDNGVSQLRPLFDLYKTTAPPVIADLGEMLLTSLKIEEQSETVKVSLGVPDSAQGQLEQLPAIVMLMAMSGGMGGGLGGGLGGFGGPPPPAGFGNSPGSIPNPFGNGGTFPMEANDAMPLPGESEPVAATMVEGLPEGLTLTARTAWSLPAVGIAGLPGAANPAANRNSDSDSPAVSTETSTETIEILIDVSGEGLENICAATGITTKTTKLNRAGTLKKSKKPLPGGIDGQKTFLPFDQDEIRPLEHPPATLRVRLIVEAPTNGATQIDLLEGSFKILTAANSNELTVENVPQTAKQPLKGAEFKAGGVKLIRGPKDANPETLKLECGKDHFLGRVQGSPDDVSSVTEIDKGNTVQRLYAKQADGKFPEDFEIRFKLHTDVAEQTVTFRIENLPLPSPESKLPASAPAVPQEKPTE